jgi:mono/diheme cytochrome c family protein
MLMTLILPGACAAAPAPDQLAAPPSPDSRLVSGSVEAGRMLAEQKCSACHAVGGAALSPVAQAPAFASLAGQYDASALATVLTESIATGHPSMPRWMFSPAEASDLLAYIRSLRSDDRS